MKSLLISIIFLFATNLSAAPIDVTQNLLNRDKLYTQYFQVMFDLSDIQRQSALNLWVNAVNKSEPGYLKGQTGVYYNLKNNIKNKQLINLIAHYYYVGDLASTKNALDFYFHSVASFLFEVAGNPIYKGTDVQNQASSALNQGLFNKVNQYRSCLETNLKLETGNHINKREGLIQANSCVSEDLKAALKTIQNILNDKDYKGPSFVQHYSGFIPGNKVEQLVENPSDANTILMMGELNSKLKNTKPQGSTKTYSALSVDDFKSLMIDKSSALNNFFTKQEGFPETHPIYSELNPGKQTKNIFGSIYQSLETAKQSIFIDVFFLGGSMGAHLAKKLISLSQQNPNLYLYLMTDRNNPLAYEKELAVIFNYLKAYSEKFEPNRIYILTPNINLKRTALPPFVDLLVDDNAVRTFLDTDSGRQFTEKLGGYPKAKSDHSKVFVIDGLLDNGVAFVGSKNLTDSSGAIATDEMTKVEGPAVKLILDSYYYDVAEAMKLNFKNVAMNAIRVKMAPIDVLERYKGAATNAKIYANAKGTTVLEIGENNAYGTIRSPLEQNIHLILSANQQIVISDQFLYDPQTVDAIRKALMQNPNLKVFIILAPLDDPLNSLKAFAHVPNNVFLNDLVSINPARVQVKWKTVPANKVQALKTVNQNWGENLSPEYHLKSISIDGISYENRNSCRSNPVANAQPILVSGSANKDNMTMTGGFREFQLAIFDKEASAKHDCAFWARWDDSEETKVAEPTNFIIPENLKQRGVTPENFLATLKTLLLYAYNFTENFF